MRFLKICVLSGFVGTATMGCGGSAAPTPAETPAKKAEEPAGKTNASPGSKKDAPTTRTKFGKPHRPG